MEIYKVFDREDIDRAIDYNFLENYGSNFCNDVAVPWWIENDDEYEEDPEYYNFREAVNNYLISQGCTCGEKVYIDVTW